MSMELAGFPFLTAILLSSVLGLAAILLVPRDRPQAVKWVSVVLLGMRGLLFPFMCFAHTGDPWADFNS